GGAFLATITRPPQHQPSPANTNSPNTCTRNPATTPAPTPAQAAAHPGPAQPQKPARAGAKLKAQVDDPAGEAAAWHPTTHPPCGQAISPSQPMQRIALALALRLELRSFP